MGYRVFASALPVLQSAAAGNFALQFGNPGSSVLVLNSASLNISGPITVEAWVKADPAILDNFYNFIVSKQLYGTGYTLLSIVSTTNPTERPFQFEANSVNGDFHLQGTSPVPISVWTHVAWVWSQDGVARLYVNGRLDASRSVPAPPVANNQNLYIGNSLFGDSYRWHGLIDELRIWNAARSQNDINQSMFLSISTSYPGLVARWGFDEGSGTVAHDSSGNHNDGSVSQANWVSADDLVLLPTPPPPITSCSNDISGKTLVTRSPTHYIYPSQYEFSQTISVTNTSGSTLNGPLFLVIDGLTPGVFVLGNQLITHCGSPNGSYLIPLNAGMALQAGQLTAALLVFTTQGVYSFSYTTRVFQGMPSN